MKEYEARPLHSLQICTIEEALRSNRAAERKSHKLIGARIMESVDDLLVEVGRMDARLEEADRRRLNDMRVIREIEARLEELEKGRL